MLCLILTFTSLNHYTFKVHIISTCPEIFEINIPQYKSKVFFLLCWAYVLNQNCSLLFLPLLTLRLWKKNPAHITQRMCVCTYTHNLQHTVIQEGWFIYFNNRSNNTSGQLFSWGCKLTKGEMKKDSRLLLLLKASLNPQPALCYHNSTREDSSHQLAKHRIHPFKEHRKLRG